MAPKRRKQADIPAKASRETLIYGIWNKAGHRVCHDDAVLPPQRADLFQVSGADELSLALLPNKPAFLPRQANRSLKIHVDVVVVAKLVRVGLPVYEAAFLDSTGGF